MVKTLVLVYFGRPQLGQAIKTHYETLELIQRYAWLWFYKKGFRTSFSTIFYEWIFKKINSHVAFYQLTTKSHLLIAFTSRDTGQYVYLFLSFCRHKFWNLPLLSYQGLSYMTKNSDQKEERKKQLRWKKKHFSSFLKRFQLPEIVSDLRVHRKGLELLSDFFNCIFVVINLY